MGDDIVVLAIVTVGISLALIFILAYIVKKVIARQSKRTKHPISRTIPPKERPDELKTISHNYMPDVKKGEEKVIQDPLNQFEKEQFHKEIREFLKESDPPK